ncbi:hypothetical protein JAAARDRAFT_68888 [Jaapia argillacea MUCL 33604]|uniref:Uncharacterized protein n=1 Tax=Jaapia argillacea MUCL 33604 TaxID=933084 RepID=A0A067PU91_9AGAM|nr:hypothetical protein JAAARDRAFT_68888 [Jaapia argillacea MUCL 33604]
MFQGGYEMVPAAVPLPATSNKPRKKRLYLVFYRQRCQWEEGIKFHTAITVAPKKPDPSCRDTWCYHVRDSMRAGMPSWEYESTQVANSDCTMVAAVLLCKLNPTTTPIGLSMLLREVPVWEQAEDRGARQWVWRATRLLVDREVIVPLRLNPDTIWQNGYHFAEDVENATGKNIPTCDIFGYPIKSEIRRT